MFTKPAFSDKTKDADIRAVHHKFKRALVNDDWHQHNLYMQLSNPKSALHKLPFGTKENLSKPEAKQAMIDFFNNFYSPSLMTVCVYSSEPLNKMEKLVTSKFKGLKAKKVDSNKDQLDISEPAPYTPDNGKRFVGLVPVNDLDELTITWNLPW